MDRDNQQERLHFYIGYLLGVIDGEGSLQLGKDGRGHYVPLIVINNTNIKIIDLVLEAIKYLGLTAYVWTPKYKKNDNCKLVHRVVIQGIKRIARTLALLQKYKYAKHDRGQILKEFCDYRLSIPIDKKYLNLQYLNEDKKYGNKEDEFKKKLTLLNRQGIRPNTKMSALSSETIRSAPKKEEDIVRSYTRV